MQIEIRPGRIENAQDFRDCLNDVAKDGKHLMFSEAPPVDLIHKGLSDTLAQKLPIFFAFDGKKLVGWCDVHITSMHETAKHRAELGMGLLEPYRGKGIGKRLLSTCINASKERAIEKIDLVVLADNTSAIKLYRAHGFKEEGRMTRYKKQNNTYTDALWMGLDL